MTQPAPPVVARLIQSALAVVDPNVRQFTYPLFTVDEDGRPELVASSVLIEIDGRTALVTAAHAISEISAVNSCVHVGLDSGIEILPSFTLSSVGGRDPFDLAAVHIMDDMRSRFRSPLPQTQMSVVDGPHMRLIHGYPVTKNTLKKALTRTPRSFWRTPSRTLLHLKGLRTSTRSSAKPLTYILH